MRMLALLGLLTGLLTGCIYTRVETIDGEKVEISGDALRDLERMEQAEPVYLGNDARCAYWRQRYGDVTETLDYTFFGATVATSQRNPGLVRVVRLRMYDFCGRPQSISTRR